MCLLALLVYSLVLHMFLSNFALGNLHWNFPHLFTEFFRSLLLTMVMLERQVANFLYCYYREILRSTTELLYIHTRHVSLKYDVYIPELFSYPVTNAVRTFSCTRWAGYDLLTFMTAGRRLRQVFEYSVRMVLYSGWDEKSRLWNHPYSYTTAKWFWHTLGVYTVRIQEPHCA